jgi:hypothetical protein
VKRTVPMKRRKPVPPRNDARKRKAFTRAYGSKERVLWVQSLPCCCGCARTPCHNAHTTTDGIGRKGHYTTIVPLHPSCHRAYDEHRAPFDAADRRAVIRLHAEVIAAQWDRMGDTT